MTEEIVSPEESDDSPVEPAEIQPFEIELGIEGEPIENGDVLINWCITPEYAVELEERGIIDPHILFVTATNNANEMQRQLIPLSELMSFARFTRAGDMNVFAWVINGKIGRKKLHKQYLGKSGGNYRTTLLSGCHGADEDLDDSVIFTQAKVEIPTTAFAKEPHPFIKWYVNLWFSENYRDGCHFRKRAMVGVPKLIPFIIWTILMLIGRCVAAAVAVAGGWYHLVEYRKIIRPYYWPFATIVKEDDDAWKSSYIISRNISIGYRTKKMNFIALFCVSPLALLIAIVLGRVVMNHIGQWPEELAIMTLRWLSGFLVVGILFDVGRLIKFWLENTKLFNAVSCCISNFFESLFIFILSGNRPTYILGGMGSGIAGYMVYFCIMYWDVAKFMLMLFVPVLIFSFVLMTMTSWMYIDPKYNKPTEVVQLMCPCEIKTVKKVPSKQMSWRLRFLNWKNKVCKPTQQG